MKKQTIELLAPAGSWEALEAAVNAGADAVYMGGKAFGARQYASNFDREEMQKAVYFAHMHRVRLYITVNTLVDDSELGELADYLLFLSNVGIDGIIVQDLGVIRLARQIVPDLPLHASTQMTVTNSEGVKLAAEAGMERVVLAREFESGRNKYDLSWHRYRNRSFYSWSFVRMLFRSMFDEQPDRRSQRQSRTLCSAVPSAL